MPGVQIKTTPSGGKYKKIDYEVVDSTPSTDQEDYASTQWKYSKVRKALRND